jgi:ABC-type nitrate/sulfonate/bicarbonate transport system substrate-binding protein
VNLRGMARLVALGLTAGAGSLALAACGSSDSQEASDTAGATAQAVTRCDQDLSKPPDKPVEIRFASATGADPYAAVFAMEGVAPASVRPNAGKWYTLKSTPFRSVQDRYTAFQAGRADALISTGPATWVAQARGVPAQIVATIAVVTPGGINDAAWIAKEDSPVSAPADLGGKKLAVLDFGSQSDLDARAAVKLGGHDVDDATYVVQPLPAMVPAVRSGQVDVGMAVEPFLSQAMHQGGVKKVFSESDVFSRLSGKQLDSYDFMWILFGKDFIAKNPGATCAFLADLNGSAKWLDGHVKEARQAFMDKKLVAVPPGAEQGYLALPDPDMPGEGMPVNVTTMKTIVGLAEQVGVLKPDQVPDLDELVAPIAQKK